MSDFLGHLVWYTIKTGGDDPAITLDVSPEQMEAWFAELKLDHKHLANSPKSVDAFRHATTGMVGAPYRSDDGRLYHLVVKETKNEIDLVVRQVMRRGLDPGATTTRVAELKYFRARRTHKGRVIGSEDVKTRLHAGLRNVDKEKVKEFIEDCMERYERGRRQLTPHKVRALMRNYVADLQGVPLTYGAFFLPMSALDQLCALQELVSRLGPACRMWKIPLIDDPEQREMVREAIDAEITERAQLKLHEISQWRDKRPGKIPSPRALGSWDEERRYLQTLLVTYAERHGMAFPAAADSLEDLRRAATRTVNIPKPRPSGG